MDNNNKYNNMKISAGIGKRIRELREIRGLTRGQLGEKVGLDANRIRQYEIGSRTPKPELVIKLADALNVNPMSLYVPPITHYVGAMLAFFEMEDNYDIEPCMINNELYIKIGNNDILNEYIGEWYDKYSDIDYAMQHADTAIKKSNVFKEYNEWKLTYPHTTDTEKELKIRQLKQQIEYMKKELKLLDSSEKE